MGKEKKKEKKPLSRLRNLKRDSHEGLQPPQTSAVPYHVAPESALKIIYKNDIVALY